jgi:GAF domain-containing protein
MAVDRPVVPATDVGFRVPPDSAALARLAVVTGELAAAASMDAIVTVVASHVRDAVAAAVSTLILRQGSTLTIIGQRGVAAAKARRWASFDVGDDNPASESVRTGQPVVVTTADEVRARYPAMAPDTPPSRSVINLPLALAGEVIGVIGLTFEDNWNPGPIELDFMMAFADACAQAVGRVQATEQAQRSTARVEFLARASAELARSLDYRTTLTEIARLSVPELADWCAVDLALDGQLVTLAIAHVDPAKMMWAQQLRAKYPPDMSSASGAAKVLRTGVGELVRDITDEMLQAGAQDPEHLQLLRELDLRSAMTVPLQGMTGSTGTITLIRSHPSPSYTPADLIVAEDLGRRAGVAIDNARLYDDVANVAAELQRAVLPDRLAQLPGWEVGACYRPDGRAEVGGDFYDAVALRDGRLAFFLGDVMGHGIQAAAAMAQMRSAVRALLTVDPEPVSVLQQLDQMFLDLGIQALVGLVYAVVDRTGAIRLANAGLCPPLLLTGSGQARFLPNTGRPPLGAGPAATVATDLFLEPGELLLAYTDGLIERRGEHLDVGLARLAANAKITEDGPVDTWLEDLSRATAASTHHDDIAAIAVRRVG